jgi:ankyrin repeat protein
MNALRTLLQLGADVNVSKPSGACPLIAAVTNGTATKVKLLLAAGCNPKVFQHSTGMGPLHLAVAKDDLPVCVYTTITLLYCVII